LARRVFKKKKKSLALEYQIREEAETSSPWGATAPALLL
jgi:hypothetical protein